MRRRAPALRPAHDDAYADKGMSIKPGKSRPVAGRDAAIDRSERREYFRITDEVIVRYRVVDKRDAGRAHAGDLYGRGCVDRTIGNPGLILNRISQTDPNVAKYLKHIESRVNEVFRLLLLQELEMGDASVMEASLSGGGLAFYTSEHLAAGTCLQIKLLLMSSWVALLVRARVVRSERRSRYLPTHPYRVAVEFDAIDEADRDILIKHILKRQAEKLRHARPDRRL